jgi:hypothetical protein
MPDGERSLGLRIGVDFDNTIAGYDAVFRAAALRAGLLDPHFRGGKQAVRDALRLLPGGELEWQKLQGQVYGAHMPSAVMLDGADAFLRRCREARHEVVVVSHKSEYGHHDPSRVNLRRAALEWMTAQGFFRADGYAIATDRVFFESTRADKIARIAALDCTYFIDDLEEVLSDPAFPDGVTRVLLAERVNGSAVHAIHCRTWRDVTGVVFGEPG